MNNSVETINAAATAIVAAESRVQQATVQVDRQIFVSDPFFFFSSFDISVLIVENLVRFVR